MDRPEILSPASMQSLKAAVLAGADAVYLGADRFSARKSAQNFSSDALREAVDFCHIRGVKVYLALNTLLYEDELPDALSLAEEAGTAGVDALILQDMGLCRLLRQAAPGLRLHASTQLSCHTPAGVDALRESGFSRVVLAREMTKEEIAACAGRGCELEVFVHGALCMSVSGQCYLSAALGGRSGNRGCCAQPCRLPFSRGAAGRPATDEAALSLKDLCLIEQVAALQEIGVCSLKIEGRMKRPEYVAGATAAYAAAVRGEAPSPTLLRDLEAVFSRDGFTNGYFTGQRGRTMFGKRRREDVLAADAGVLERLQRLYARETPRVPVRFALRILPGQPATLRAADEDGHAVTVAGDIPQAAVSQELTAQQAAVQLQKTGGTPFFVTEDSYDIKAGLWLSASELNRLRRAALEQLSARRLEKNALVFDRTRLTPAVQAAGSGAPAAQPLWVIRVASLQQLMGIPAEEDAALRILPLSSAASAVIPPSVRWGVEIPRGLFGREESVQHALIQAKKRGACCALCGNIGAIPLALRAGLMPLGGVGLNIANSSALAAFAVLGLRAATWSAERPMGTPDSSSGRVLPAGRFVYGRLPLMLTRNCPAKRGDTCGSCRGTGGITDRKGIVFPVMCVGGCSEVLNPVPLYLADRLSALPSAAFYYYHFTDEAPEKVAEVLAAYRRGLPPVPGERFTRGIHIRTGP